MARNASGTYSLPAGNPVVTGTAIDSSDFNDTMNDIAVEITDSLSRSGEGGMLAALEGFDGTVSLPGFAFSNDTNSGFYRIGDDNLGVAVGGVKILDIAATGLTIAAGLTLSAGVAVMPVGAVGAPSMTFVGDLDTGVYRIGADNIGISVGGAKILDIKGAAAGGLFINNTLTGGGSERALTTSDLETTESIVKTANESKTNDAVLADDNAMVGFTLEADTWYSIKGWLEVIFSTSSGGIQFFLQFSNTPVNVGGWSAILTGDLEILGDNAGIEVALEYDSATETSFGATIDGCFKSNASVGGTIDFQWAQKTSHANASQINSGSYITMKKLS
jgi:hypothetical protein